jgi:hypothetical protein
MIRGRTLLPRRIWRHGSTVDIAGEYSFRLEL